MVDIEQLADSGELFDDHYKLIRTLSSEGGTADVWLALDAKTVKNKRDLEEAPYLEDEYLNSIGLLVAIKIYRPKNALDIEGEEKFASEYMIVFNCHHANLIHPTHFSIYKEIPYLVLPYCKQGSSELYIGSMTKNDGIWKYIFDVASGLDYLHKNIPPIIHQDIKPANVLIDDLGNYAITDFGISERFDYHSEDEYGEGRSGTAAYMSPERFAPDFEPSKESDIWAVGATLYELITGNVPFGEDGGCVQPDGKLDLKFPKEISSDIQRLICACLDKDPSKRPTAEVLKVAAQKKMYPVKPFPVKMLFVALSAVLFVGFLFFLLRAAPSSSEESPSPVENNHVNDIHSLEELHAEALLWMNSNNADSLQEGIKKMRELAKENYIPSLYQLSLTYGWFTDPMSVKRKEILGIEVGNKSASESRIEKYLPISDRINEKAISYLTKIVELSNPVYSEWTMESSLRLGLYYCFLKKNQEKAKDYFAIAKREAQKLARKDYVEIADSWIKYSDKKKDEQ
jgi:serine/threonine protein kinase